MDEQNWEHLTDAEMEAEILATVEQPDPNEALPPNVQTLIAELTALGWVELDTLVPMPECATPPTVMEWAGLALAAIPMTDQGRARGDEFRKDLARLAAPGLKVITACAAMKKGRRGVSFGRDCRSR